MSYLLSEIITMPIINIVLLISALLEDKPDANEAEFITKARDFYRSCMNEGILGYYLFFGFHYNLNQ